MYVNFAHGFLLWRNMPLCLVLPKVHQSGFILIHLNIELFELLPNPLICGLKEPLPPPEAIYQDHQVSSPGESHPQALSEPDMNLSAHPAPIIQPTAKSPPANARTGVVHDERSFPANVLHDADGDSAFCISCVPNGSRHGSCV